MDNLKSWPERIYLQHGADDLPDYKELSDVCWCEDEIFDGDVEYVRADLAPAGKDALEIWDAALAQVAVYVENHCVDGEMHAEAILKSERPLQFLADQAQALDMGYGVDNWISTDDRLPEDGQSVAFVVSCKNPNWDHLDGRVLGGTYHVTNGYRGGFGVPGLSVSASHWMPLPKPPEAMLLKCDKPAVKKCGANCADGGKCGAGGYCDKCHWRLES